MWLDWLWKIKNVSRESRQATENPDRSSQTRQHNHISNYKQCKYMGFLNFLQNADNHTIMRHPSHTNSRRQDEFTACKRCKRCWCSCRCRSRECRSSYQDSWSIQLQICIRAKPYLELQVHELAIVIWIGLGSKGGHVAVSCDPCEWAQRARHTKDQVASSERVAEDLEKMASPFICLASARLCSRYP